LVVPFYTEWLEERFTVMTGWKILYYDGTISLGQIKRECLIRGWQARSNEREPGSKIDVVVSIDNWDNYLDMNKRGLLYGKGINIDICSSHA
jgi:hypothetical protein